jgi:uncharacterized membrane protein
MAGANRLGYVDWARGLVVLLMFHTHGFFAWVRQEDQSRAAFRYTRLVGGYPAVVFLFLAGLALALLTEARWRKGTTPGGAPAEGIRRGLEILGWAFLFRLWMFATSGFAQPSDLLRVDVLNCIGASLTLLAVASFGWPRRAARAASAAGFAVAVAALTPLAWDSGIAARLLPDYLARYVSGRLTDAYFPVFPWAAYAGAGAAAGFLLSWARERRREAVLFIGLGLVGAVCIPLGLWLDRVSPWMRPRYDFWYTSPHYTLMKTGVALVVLSVAPLADRLPGAGLVRLLGRTSLLMYWVHLEIVYGMWVTPWARSALSVEQAALGVVLLTAAMAVLAIVRTRGHRATTSVPHATATGAGPDAQQAFPSPLRGGGTGRGGH